MKNSKWLSNAVHMDEIRTGTLNLVHAPVGSGKTYWALNVLSKTVSKPYKMVYLIDTINGKEQLLKNENTCFYSDSWRATVEQDTVWFGEAREHNKIVVMTYAKFGKLVSEHEFFGFDFELILCDEIHNLPRFASFRSKEPNDEPYHKIAQLQIEIIARIGGTRIVGITATPKRAEKVSNDINYITVDEDVRQLKTKEVIPYSNINTVFQYLSPSDTGIIYIGHIAKMKEICSRAKELGFNAIAVWSINNIEHPMTDEQLNVRQYILDKSELPPQYNLFIINASSETSINIFGQVDYIVAHSQSEETQIQVRGRYRKDLEKLYCLNYDAEIVIPSEYMGVKLFKEDRDALCNELQIRNKQGNIVSWTTVKNRILEEGYQITEKRENNKRYVIITE